MVILVLHSNRITYNSCSYI